MDVNEVREKENQQEVKAIVTLLKSGKTVRDAKTGKGKVTETKVLCMWMLQGEYIKEEDNNKANHT